MTSALNGRQGAIFRFSLDDQMLDVRMRLRSDAVNGIADGRFRIVNSGNDRDFQRCGLNNRKIKARYIMKGALIQFW